MSWPTTVARRATAFATAGVSAHELRLLRDVEHGLEDAIRCRRVSETCPHVHEQRRVEARRVVREPTRPLVAKVEVQPIDGLAVAQAFEALEDHDRRHHARADAAATARRVEVGKHLVGKEQMPLRCEQPEHAPLTDRPVAQLAHRPEQVVMRLGAAHRHASKTREAPASDRAASAFPQQAVGSGGLPFPRPA